MVDLKQKGTVARVREILKKSVVTLVSSEAHRLRKRPGMLSRPAALRVFTLLSDLLTCVEVSVGACSTSSGVTSRVVHVLI